VGTLALNGECMARMGHDDKTDAILHDLFYEVFPKQK